MRDKVPHHGSQKASRNKPEIIARLFSSTGISACANNTTQQDRATPAGSNNAFFRFLVLRTPST
jgi:hypothetical protein